MPNSTIARPVTTAKINFTVLSRTAQQERAEAAANSFFVLLCALSPSALCRPGLEKQKHTTNYNSFAVHSFLNGSD